MKNKLYPLSPLLSSCNTSDHSKMTTIFIFWPNSSMEWNSSMPSESSVYSPQNKLCFMELNFFTSFKPSIKNHSSTEISNLKMLWSAPMATSSWSTLELVKDWMELKKLSQWLVLQITWHLKLSQEKDIHSQLIFGLLVLFSMNLSQDLFLLEKMQKILWKFIKKSSKIP